MIESIEEAKEYKRAVEKKLVECAELAMEAGVYDQAGAFFGIAALFNSEIHYKNTEIAGLNKQIEALKGQNVVENIKILRQTDTISLIEEKLVYVSAIKHDTIVKYDTIFKQITRVDTVFINENKQEELIANNEILMEANNIEIPSSNYQFKKKNKRRFVFRFGSLTNIRTNKVKEEPLLSLKTEFK